jgi:hypothetical protein
MSFSSFRFQDEHKQLSTDIAEQNSISSLINVGVADDLNAVNEWRRDSDIISTSLKIIV